MPGRIFLNYRRGDDPGFALALYSRLEQSFQTEQLFMDVEGGIPAGADFVEVLKAQVAECDVLLALIGQNWLTAVDDAGGMRLQNPNDFVRVEIESAMRLGKRVIPVLLNKAEMPRASDLPETLQPLARRNAVRLTQDRFRADAQGLINALEGALRDAEIAREAASAAAGEAKRRQVEAAVLKSEEAAQAEKERVRLDAITGLSPEQIVKAEELANWEFIKVSEREQEFRDHLARFPSGVTSRFAQAKLEASVWLSLGATPSIEQLQGFLAEFPEGVHASDAARRCRALEGDLDAAAVASERNTTKELKGPPSRRWVVAGLGGAFGLAAVGAVVALELRTGRPLWRALYDASSRTFIGPHSDTDPSIGQFLSVAYSPNGDTVLSGSLDGTSNLWSLATGEPIRTLKGSVPVRSVAYSPDGSRAILGAESLKAWDLASGNVVATLSDLNSEIYAVAIPSSGRGLLFAGGDSMILYDTGKDKVTGKFKEADDIWSIGISADGQTALTGCDDGTINVWDLAAGKKLRTFKSDLGSVRTVALSPDAKTALSGSRATLTLWDLTAGKELRSFRGHSDFVTGVVFLPDGRRALSSSEDKTLKLWEISTGNVLHTFTGHADQVRSVTVSSDGRSALSGSRDTTLKSWHLPADY
jgi:WD40 repeat protein